MDAHEEIGLAVLATTRCRSSRCSCRSASWWHRRQIFHEFGVTIVAAVLISMFVSFTLDPMLSSTWHDPPIAVTGSRSPARDPQPHHRRVTVIDAATEMLRTPTRTSCAGAAHRLATWLWRSPYSPSAWRWCRCWATSPAQGRLRKPRSTSTRRWVRRKPPKRKPGRSSLIAASRPRCASQMATLNTGNAQGKIYASIDVRLVDRVRSG